MDAERVRKLPGKIETISNVVVNKLNYFVERTQAIILSPTREAAQAICTLISASDAASAITFHLSVGGTSIHEDSRQLWERPHVVVGTTGRISDLLRRKTIDPNDIKFLCVDGVEHLLSATYENEFAEFCGQLPRDIELVLLPTKPRYKTPHDLNNLFAHEPLHFLVREGLEPPESSIILRDPEPLDIDPNRIEEATWGSDGYHGTTLDVGKDVPQEFESCLELSTGIRDSIDMAPAATASAPLSPQCGVCNAPPIVGSRPTATMCGHIFCSEYVSKILGVAVTGLTPR